MRFLTFDELTPEMEVDRTLLHLASFGGTFPRRSINLLRRRLKAMPEYAAIFAAERGRLLGQTYVLRVPYTFRDGTEMVTGIAGVGTRPDRRRAGVARAILSEIHRREKEDGIRFSTLWTNRSWGAHRLYEKLGYRDVYASPWAVHAPLERSPPPRRGARAGRRSDLPELERLYARFAEGRLGFTQRPTGSFSGAAAAGELDPTTDMVVFRSRGKLRGYALLESTRWRTICGELVADSGATRRALVSEVERRARRRPFAFTHTAATDAPELFRGRGFSIVPTGWYVLMACSLGGHWTSRAALSQFATDDRRFLCLSWDRF
jgi:GNAT superfamily N-acetyltransferase